MQGSGDFGGERLVGKPECARCFSSCATETISIGDGDHGNLIGTVALNDPFPDLISLFPGKVQVDVGGVVSLWIEKTFKI
jgi:hypothetical protein